MAPEKVTVTITSSVGEDANLIVSDAMRQILDFFELLGAAGGKEASSIAWQLVSVSMNSPLQVTAQAVPMKDHASVSVIARHEKALVAEGLNSIIRGDAVPIWMDRHAREKAKSLFQRNLDKIGRTDIRLDPQTPLISLESGSSRRAISVVDRYERFLADKEGDLSRKEYGSIEALVLDTTTYKGHPALLIKEWLSNAQAKCVFSDEVAEIEGPKNTWAETWAHKRVILSGEITYNKTGVVSHIYADSIENVNSNNLRFEDIADPTFTGGLSISEFVKIQREREGD